MFRDRAELMLFRAGTVPETVPVRSLVIRKKLDYDEYNQTSIYENFLKIFCIMSFKLVLPFI